MRLAVTLSAFTLSSLGASALPDPLPAGADLTLGQSASTLAGDSSRSRAVGCPGARRGLRWYRRRANELRAERDAGRYPVGHVERYGGCSFVAWKAEQWRRRALHEARLTRRWRRSVATPIGAIRYVFGAHALEAIAVASCESHLSIWARNGQYLGLFQMGAYARARYGHGWTPLAQARAAFAYFRDAGWAPWACRP